jgi:hypothetical protein
MNLVGGKERDGRQQAGCSLEVSGSEIVTALVQLRLPRGRSVRELDENGLVLYSVTSEVTSGFRLYPSSYELRVTGTSGFRYEKFKLWEKV